MVWCVDWKKLHCWEKIWTWKVLKEIHFADICLYILRTKWWKIQYKFSFSFTAFFLLSGLQPWRWSFHSQWICNCGISVFTVQFIIFLSCLSPRIQPSIAMSVPIFYQQHLWILSIFRSKLFPPRFGHSSVSDTFQGAFAWPLSFHFLDSLDTDSDFFVRGNSGTNWMHEMVWKYDISSRQSWQTMCKYQITKVDK